MRSSWILITGMVCLLAPSLAADDPREDRGRLERLHAMALRAQTVSGDPSPQAVTAPASFSLTLEGDLDLGGYVFQEGVPFIHNDGGATYRNTALGLNALISTTPGVPSAQYGRGNTALGYSALRFNTEGYRNTATGTFALLYNTTGSENTASGVAALYSNTEGLRNTASGHRALRGNTTGDSNTATGSRALTNNTEGNQNTASGQNALYSNTTGVRNTAIGSEALAFNTSGSNNVAIGRFAGFYWTTGDNNVAIGFGTAAIAGESGTIRIGGQNNQQATFIEGISDGQVAGDPVCITASDELGLCPAMNLAQGGLSQASPQLWEQLKRQDAELAELRRIVADQRRRLEQLERDR